MQPGAASSKKRGGAGKQPSTDLAHQRQKESTDLAGPSDDPGDKDDGHDGRDGHHEVAAGHTKSQGSSHSKATYAKQKSADHKQPLINPWTPQGNVGKHGQKSDQEHLINLRNQNQLLQHSTGQRQTAHPQQERANHKRF